MRFFATLRWVNYFMNVVYIFSAFSVSLVKLFAFLMQRDVNHVSLQWEDVMWINQIGSFSAIEFDDLAAKQAELKIE